MVRRLSLVAAALLLILSIMGSANPSIKWGIAWHYYPVGDTANYGPIGRMMGRHFDLGEFHATASAAFVKFARQTNSSFKSMLYDNFTNTTFGGEDAYKWRSLQNEGWRINSSTGYSNFEKFFAHFSGNTRLYSFATDNTQDGPREYRFGYGVVPGIFLEQTPGGTLQDFSRSDGNIDFTHLSYDTAGYDTGSVHIDTVFTTAAQGQMLPFTALGVVGAKLYVGNPDRFYQVWITLTSPLGTDATDKWQYLATDSTWKDLPPYVDFTLNLHKTGQNYIQFDPPSDWGYKSVSGQRGYWMRDTVNVTSGSTPVFTGLKHEGWYTLKSNGDYIVPGWDAAYDLDGNDYLDATEFSNVPASDSASARFKHWARVPTFQWQNPRFVMNPSDTTYQRVNAQIALYNVTRTDLTGDGSACSGIYEDNCIPSDGSIDVRGYSDRLNLADAGQVGNYLLRYASSTGGRISEFPGASPGVYYQSCHSAMDSVVNDSLFLQHGKLYQGNSSQFFADNFRYTYSPAALTWSGTRQDSGGYAFQHVHGAMQRERWVPYGAPFQLGNEGSPVVTAPIQWQMAKDVTSNGRVGEFLIRQAKFDSLWSEQPWYSYTGVTKNRDRMTALAYAYMSNYGTSYFTWTPVNGVTQYGGLQNASVGYLDSTAWWPAVAFNLGTSVSDSDSVFASIRQYTTARSPWDGVESAPWYETAKVYSRHYQKGYVFFKPRPYSDDWVSEDSMGTLWSGYVPVWTDGTQSATSHRKGNFAADIGSDSCGVTTLTMPNSKGYSKVNYDGTLSAAVTTITIKNGEGLIMSDTTGINMGADVTPPTATVERPVGNWGVPGDHTVVLRCSEPCLLDLTEFDCTACADWADVYTVELPLYVMPVVYSGNDIYITGRFTGLIANDNNSRLRFTIHDLAGNQVVITDTKFTPRANRFNSVAPQATPQSPSPFPIFFH